MYPDNRDGRYSNNNNNNNNNANQGGDQYSRYRIPQPKFTSTQNGYQRNDFPAMARSYGLDNGYYDNDESLSRGRYRNLKPSDTDNFRPDDADETFDSRRYDISCLSVWYF